MATKPPILVTGSHRSGTTWVGRMLAAAPSTFYIHEPFSVSDPPARGICNIRFQHWFTYITTQNENHYFNGLKNTINLKYDWQGALKETKSFSDFKLALKEYRNVNDGHKSSKTVILKDPIAFFSSAWLAERFETRCVVLIRHPAAFISSIMKLKWEHPFQHFLQQELMMKDLLGPFKPEIEVYANERKPLFDQAILLWRIIHHQVLRFQKEHPEWIFIRHEDISQDPLTGFQTLFKKLDLEFTSKAKTIIQDYSGAKNPGETSAPVGSEETLKRNSVSNIKNWKARLSEREIHEIRKRVDDISHLFYSNDDWQ